jgi:hypothetical protein
VQGEAAAFVAQALGESVVAPSGPGLVQAAGMDLVGTDAGGEGEDDLRRRAAGQVEGDPTGLEVGAEGGEGAVEPPALGAAMGPTPGRRVVQDIHRQHGPVLDGVEGGVVGEAQVLAEPDEGRGEHLPHMGTPCGFWRLKPPEDGHVGRAD